MTTDFEERAVSYHEALPGLVRAALIDHGLTDLVINDRLLGFDGESITVPVRNSHGSVVFFERWTGWAVGVPVDRSLPIALYGAERLAGRPYRLVLAEGILEALVLESHGFASVAATGSGRFFKVREWGTILQAVPGMVLAYKRGEKQERLRYLPTREKVLSLALSALPRAQVLWWPEEVGENGGVFEYLGQCGHSADDLKMLLDGAR